jgi:ATP adenylyltransferase
LAVPGDVAQLGERLHGMQEVGGSSPPVSTIGSAHRQERPAGDTHIEHLWAPWRMEYVGRAGEPATSCFLCDLAGEGMQSDVVVESTELTFSCLNRFPYNSGHLMVAPRRHVPDVTVLDAAEAEAVMTGVQRALRALSACMGPDGFNIGINQGEAAGASVEHLHVHVVPRWSGDTNFMPVVGEVKVLPEHLAKTAAVLREALARPDLG